jgi:hypothetical protein
MLQFRGWKELLIGSGGDEIIEEAPAGGASGFLAASVEVAQWMA